jgi:hypothetical protein
MAFDPSAKRHATAQILNFVLSIFTAAKLFL